MNDINILTFDIEEWYVYQSKKYYGDPLTYLPRLEKKLNQILDLLDQYELKATFFCLGEIARNFPNVVKIIDQRGHHIGSHSLAHNFVTDMSPESFFQDTKKSLAYIEDLIGKKVESYRAPAFSVTKETPWAIEALIENGVKYDCSVFPAARRFGGYPSFGTEQPSIINIGNDSIKEFPMTFFNFWGSKVAFSGGGYFRLFPYSISKLLIKNKTYNMFYFHIRDFDEGIFDSLSMSDVKSSKVDKFKNFYGIKGNYPKFQKLISDFKFYDLEQANRLIDWEKAPKLQITG